ncbi:MAG: efflux RND transporter permease subunit [Deltaproteobacteria bacterium]|nr:efflux RND transporter permease subunit [Candidatus Zymogenaceae bacterium]
MIRFWVKNHLFVNMIVVAVIVLGLFFVSKLNREVFPSVDYGYVVITTTYPGATPEVVEKTITTPIEDAIADVTGINSIDSVSSEGVSTVTVQAESDVQGTELDQLLNDLKNEVDKIKRDLPADGDEPRLVRRRPEFPVVTVAVGGDIPEETLRYTADRLKNEIEVIEGVGTVDLTGYRDREIHVLVDPLRMEAAGLSFSAITGAILSRNVNIPAGSVDVQTKEILVRTTGEALTAADIGAVVVKSGGNGVVYVRDVARVDETFQKETVIGRLDGRRTINLSVSKKSDGDVVKIVEEIGKLLEEERTALPSGATLKMVHDRSKAVKTRQETLLTDGTLGLLLVVVVIYLFLGSQFAFWTAMSIPFSFLATIIYMYFTGTTMNLFSMFGLLLALGEVADNAIVVTENYFRYRQLGYTPEDASVLGTNEIALPVIASKATNIASFIPLLMMSGIQGRFLSSIPEITIVAFIISGLQAFFILPSNLNQFVKISVATTQDDFRSWFSRFRDFYGRVLAAALKRRYLIFIGLNGIAVIAIILAVFTMKFVLRGQTLAERFTITVTNPIDTNLAETDRIMKKVEALVAGLPQEDIAAFTTSVGRSSRRNTPSGTFSGSVTVELTEHGYLETGAERLVASLGEKTALIPGPTSITYSISREGPSSGTPVSVEIRGSDFDILEKLSEDVKRELGTMRGVTSIDSDFRRGKQEMRIAVDEYRAKRLGLSTSFIAGELRAALSGADGGSIRRGDDTVDIRVEYPEPFQTPLSVMNFTLPGAGGERIPIRSVAAITTGKGLFRINHSERKRTITVSADIVRGQNTSPEVNAALMEKFGNFSALYPGYVFDYTGEYEDTREAYRSMVLSFILALSIIYGVLTVMFRSLSQPFIIMLAIPFAFIGVVFGLFIMGIDLSLNAVIGIVALLGIVVNNSILLVDFVNRARDRGADIYDAVIDSGKTRLRPIILTSLTTLLGLLPMAFGLGGSEPYLAPMAISIFWGLLFSTPLTLFVVPCLYLIVEDIKKKSLGGILVVTKK